MIIKTPQQKLYTYVFFGAFFILVITFGLYFGLASKIENHNYGAIASNGFECAAIGANILKQGGSAVDAAISVLFCEGVAVPQFIGLGGGFLMTIYKKEGRKIETLVAREKAPIEATANMFVGNGLLGKVGGMAVAVPGELKGYWEAHQKYGKLPWRQLIEPSINLCKVGTEATRKVASVLKFLTALLQSEPSLREVFINPATSLPWVEGELMKRPKLAESLEIIAREGADAMYSKNGSLLKPLLDDIKSFGGIIAKEDFLNYKVIWGAPIETKIIDNMTLYTIPLPGSGVVLKFILDILKNFKLDKSSLSWHRVVEAFKFAYAKRTNLGDPAFVDGIEQTLSEMNSPQFIHSIHEKIDDSKTFNDFGHYGANFSNVEDHGTAHISIVAPNGDVVSVTSSLNYYFGASIRSRKTGIILNNQMDDFSTPGVTNFYGVPSSPVNYIVPGKRPMSSMSPTIIIDKNGDAKLVIGGAGGSKITSSVAYTIIRHLYLNESIDVAMKARRLHHQLAPMMIQYEDGFEVEILEELVKRGHVVQMIPSKDGFAALQAISREADGSLRSVNDIRRGGSSIVFKLNDEIKKSNYIPQKKLLIFAFLGAIVVVAVILGLYVGLVSKIDKQNYGAIASNGYECAKIGANILKQGGSAVDAAISVLFCEGVAVPQSMGLGGGFLMTIYKKEGRKVETLVAREVAPIKATANMYVGNGLLGQVGGMAVAVPGELKGYWEAHQKYGILPWRQLIEPSINLCKVGSEATRKVASVFKLLTTRILSEPSLREVFINPATSLPWVEGELMKRPKLAESLEIIAREGADAMYSKNGSLLKPLLDDIKSFGGIIAKEDFLNYKVIWGAPIETKIIDNMTLYTIPLPGSGVVLKFILDILKNYKLDKSSLSWHRVVEAFKFAYAKRTKLGDPAFVDGIEQTLSEMNSPQFIHSIHEKIDDSKTFNDFGHYGANFSNVEDHGTAHISIVAPNGDVVSVTSSVNEYLGASIRSRKTGIILNNQMDDFSTPGVINIYGVPSSPANYIVPGKRPMSSMSPTIIIDKNGDAKLVIGGAGGSKITSSVAYTIIRHLYLNESIDVAMKARRVHHQLAPMMIQYENGFEVEILEELEKRGHIVQMIPSDDGFAALQAISRDADGSLTSVNDVRRGGSTIVFRMNDEIKKNNL